MKNTQTAMKIRRRREKQVKMAIHLAMYFALLMVIGFLSKENYALRSSIDETINEYNTVISQKDNDIIKLNFTINDLNNIINKLYAQIKDVAAVNESYVDELNMLRSRSELYDKYEYAIINNGNRTELTYEEIELGEELMVAKGYDPNLMFGSIMVESNANPNAVNKSSGATGYGQFLDSTARWVWTKIMGNDSYYSDIRKDGKSNIQMMAAYYDYLYSVTGNTFKVVKCYSGNSTDEGTRRYIARVNKFINKVGATLN